MKFLRYWLPVIIWMVVIFVMSTEVGSSANSSRIIEPVVRWVKPDATPEQFEFAHFLARKLGHLSEYAVLALLLFRALKNTLSAKFASSSWQTAGITLFITASYAATDEFHQSFVASRTPAFGDVMIDSGGGLIALLFVMLWCHLLAPRLRPKAEPAQT